MIKYLNHSFLADSFFKPVIESQRELKKSVDEKQDKLIGELKENQLAVRKGLKDISTETNRDIITLNRELPT